MRLKDGGKRLLVVPTIPPDVIEKDAELVKSFVTTGDPVVFSMIYERHQKRIFYLALRMLGNSTDAEEMVQEVFLHLFQKIHGFRFESAFSTWLHRVAVNLILMKVRRKSLPTESLNEMLSADYERATPPQLRRRDSQLEGSCDRLALEQCIAALPAGCRLVLILHDVEGWEHREIAEFIDRTVGNSKSQLHKARARLRELLKVYGAAQHVH